MLRDSPGSGVDRGSHRRTRRDDISTQARLGSNTYGILSNQHIDEVAHSTHFDVTVSFTEDTFTYDETTEIEHQKYPSVVMHTDRNTLTLISRDE